jgi:DNA-binding NarL/FixJ family response regulator
VIGEANGVEDLLAQMRATCPDLMLLDWELPRLAGSDLLTTVRQACPDVFVIALSGRPEARRAALAAGVDAFVGKTDPPERLMTAINCCRQE